MSILIGADFVPTDTNEEYFVKADKEYILGEKLCKIFEEVDFRIINLETPFANVSTPIEKYGPCLMADPKSVNLLKAVNVNLCTLANNHIMDQGKGGYSSTIKTLYENHIEYVGCGQNKSEAARPFCFESAGKKIGVYACSEHEFSIADQQRPGANAFHPTESLTHIESLKNESDYIIVLYHGGKEHYRYPSPDLQINCRKFIDAGADFVVCQHSHCIGCKEQYHSGTIVYGQGNLLFDRSNNDFWKTGLLIKICDDFSINYIPVKKSGNKARLAENNDKEQILDDFYKRSDQIKETGFINSNYTKFARQCIYDYLWVISGAGRSLPLRMLNKLSKYRFYRKFVHNKYSNESLMALINYFECEAHRELIIEGLKNFKDEESINGFMRRAR